MHSNLFDRAGSNPSRGAGEKNTFLGVVHQAIFQSLTSSIRQPSLFSFWWDGSAKRLLHTWSRLGVTSSCYVSFLMCVWISTCLGFLLRVLLSTLEDKAPPVQSETEETHEALDGSWNLQDFSKLCHSKIREHHRICNSSWPVACCKLKVAVKGHSANAEALLDLMQNLWIEYDSPNAIEERKSWRSESPVMGFLFC